MTNLSQGFYSKKSTKEGSKLLALPSESVIDIINQIDTEIQLILENTHGSSVNGVREKLAVSHLSRKNATTLSSKVLISRLADCLMKYCSCVFICKPWKKVANYTPQCNERGEEESTNLTNDDYIEIRYCTIIFTLVSVLLKF